MTTTTHPRAGFRAPYGARDFARLARDYSHRRPRATEADLRHVENLAHLLDARFRIPGLNWRFGWDSIIGLVPGIGDLSTFGVSAYIIFQAWRMGARKRAIVNMLTNAGVDTVVGAIPLIGNIFDFGFKANRRNARILRAELERHRHRA